MLKVEMVMRWEHEKDLNKTARDILEFIRENPGLNFNEIARRLNLAKGDLQYHLHRLEKMNLITSKRSGLKRHYFPKGIFNEREREILALLSSENIRDIIIYLIANPGASQTDLCQAVKLSPPTVNYYINKLKSLMLVKSERYGKYVRYYFIGDKSLFIKLFKNYHPSLIEK
jgi:predicted transcriptional regulator